MIRRMLVDWQIWDLLRNEVEEIGLGGGFGMSFEHFLGTHSICLDFPLLVGYLSFERS